MSDEQEQTVTIPVSEYLELLKHKPDGKSSLAVRTGSVSDTDRLELLIRRGASTEQGC